ncbi:MAG: glycosyltransferase family 2 protein [Microthrixaceae bacterium]
MIPILFCVVGWLLGCLLFARPKTVKQLCVANRSPLGVSPAQHLDAAVLFDVIIPARNEEASLGLLLADLAELPKAGNRIIIVDDHSTDCTAEIASKFSGVEVISAAELPEGWTGKSWACHSGFEHLRQTSSGEKRGLVFLDADVRVLPEVTEQLVRHQRATGALVSVQPWNEAKRIYEKLSALFNVIALMGTAMTSRARSTGAFGPVLVTTPEDYLRAGGHSAVRHQVVEDLALSANYRLSGIPVELFCGAQDLRFRMYPDGLRQLTEGWSKNFATGAGSTQPLRLLAAVVWITSLGSATAQLVETVLNAQHNLIGAALYLGFATQLAWMFHKVGNFGVLTAAVFPIHVVFFVGVFTWSLWRTYVRRSVTWRGRSIRVGAKSNKPC